MLMIVSCDQERLEPIMTVAEGGGKLTIYSAYAIGTESDTDIYGRIVFYKDNIGRTLVQVSVYNTEVGTLYPTSIMTGPVGDEGSPLIALYDIVGKQANGLDFGELSDTKLFTITSTAFFDALTDLDPYINT